MSRPAKIRRAMLGLALVAFSMPASFALAADAKGVAGTYSYVSVVTTSASGEKSEPFGPNPTGMAMFGTDGRFMITVMKPGLPKFASNSRTTGTADEMKAVVSGSISYVGKYKVEGDALVLNIEHSTFPNWDGVTQKRTFKVEGDMLKWHTPAASGGGTADAVLKRVK
jgi:hypothetical protein